MYAPRYSLCVCVCSEGVNAAVVLLILLLSVPLQLILSHLVAMSPTTEGRGDITEARSEAMEQLVDTAEAVFDSLHSTITYYSTWNRLKELVLVPYRRTSRTNLKSTVFKSKAGTTTILISSMDETKTKKTSSSDPTKNAGQSETSKTGKTGSSTTSTDQGKQPTLKSQAGSSESETKTEKAENTPKVESTKVTTTTTKTKLPLIIEEVSHAKEVEEYLMNEVYFAQLKTPRNKKPSSVLYSVGQIVQHRTAEYVGVIIGWDKVAMVTITAGVNV